MAGDNPDITKLCEANYAYTIKLYVGSSGDMILESQNSVLKSLVKTDEPLSNNNVFPNLQLTLVIENDIHVLIVKHKKDLVISLSMSVLQMHIDPSTGTRSIESDTGLFDLKFQAIILEAESTQISSEDNEAVSSNSDDTKSSISADNIPRTQTIKFKLSCTEHRNRFKKAINFNMSEEGASPSVTSGMAMAYGLSSVITTAKSVIFQNPDIETPYLQITSPILNLKDFCYHMQTVYELYAKGIIVYQDLKYFYVIPAYSDAYAIAENEFDTVHIYIYGINQASTANAVGYYADADSSRYVIVTTGRNTYTIIQNGEFLKETQGNKFKVHTADLGDASISYEGDAWSGADAYTELDSGIEGSCADSNDKVRYFYNDLNNKAIIDAHVFHMASQALVIQILLRNIDMSILTFNRSYKLVFKDDLTIDERYGGMYRLYTVSQFIYANNAEPLTSMANITLLKIP
jgi:hypothetical protein